MAEGPQQSRITAAEGLVSDKAIGNIAGSGERS